MSYYDINEEAHRELMNKLTAMSPEEQRQTLLNAGILDANGQFTEPYAELADIAAKELEKYHNVNGLEEVRALMAEQAKLND